MDAVVTGFFLRIGSLYAYGILCPGPVCLMANDIRGPWAWSRPCGPVPYMLYGIIKVEKNADGISQEYV